MWFYRRPRKYLNSSRCNLHKTRRDRKPRIEINFRESIRGSRARCLSVLFAESLSLREIQSRARAHAPSDRLRRVCPSATCTRVHVARGRACVTTHVHAIAAGGHTAAMCTRYRSAFLRGMSTRYRTLIEERKVHNYAATLSRVTRGGELRPRRISPFRRAFKLRSRSWTTVALVPTMMSNDG